MRRKAVRGKILYEISGVRRAHIGYKRPPKQLKERAEIHRIIGILRSVRLMGYMSNKAYGYLKIHTGSFHNFITIDAFSMPALVYLKALMHHRKSLTYRRTRSGAELAVSSLLLIRETAKLYF